MGMTIDEINKEICFAKTIIKAINNVNNVKVPMLMYDEEKAVTKKALQEYIYKLESELRGDKMRMSIEQIIKYLPAPICGDTVIGKEKQKEYDAHDSAVIILHKYQKIQEIMDELNGDFYGSYLKDRQTLEKIYEVMEDEDRNDD